MIVFLLSYSYLKYCYTNDKKDKCGEDDIVITKNNYSEILTGLNLSEQYQISILIVDSMEIGSFLDFSNIKSSSNHLEITSIDKSNRFGLLSLNNGFYSLDLTNLTFDIKNSINISSLYLDSSVVLSNIVNLAGVNKASITENHLNWIIDPISLNIRIIDDINITFNHDSWTMNNNQFSYQKTSITINPMENSQVSIQKTSDSCKTIEMSMYDYAKARLMINNSWEAVCSCIYCYGNGELFIHSNSSVIPIVIGNDYSKTGKYYLSLFTSNPLITNFSFIPASYHGALSTETVITIQNSDFPVYFDSFTAGFFYLILSSEIVDVYVKNLTLLPDNYLSLSQVSIYEETIELYSSTKLRVSNTNMSKNTLILRDGARFDFNGKYSEFFEQNHPKHIHIYWDTYDPSPYDGKIDQTSPIVHSGSIDDNIVSYCTLYVNQIDPNYVYSANLEVIPYEISKYVYQYQLGIKYNMSKVPERTPFQTTPPETPDQSPSITQTFAKTPDFTEMPTKTEESDSKKSGGPNPYVIAFSFGAIVLIIMAYLWKKKNEDITTIGTPLAL